MTPPAHYCVLAGTGCPVGWRCGTGPGLTVPWSTLPLWCWAPGGAARDLTL
jgi:hypothetical protein